MYTSKLARPRGTQGLGRLGILTGASALTEKKSDEISHATLPKDFFYLDTHT